ncbi:regulation of response to stimulus [Branchiostoma belcheri]|nr:regulation of response to stimulus [Branchiostoma belcheri]
MYNGNIVGGTALHARDTQGSPQTDDNTHHQINEDEVYNPSHHDYSEIKDEDTNGERKPASEPRRNETIDENIRSAQASQSENFENEYQDSVPLSVVHEVTGAELTTTTGRKPGENTLLYKTDERTVTVTGAELTTTTGRKPSENTLLYKTDEKTVHHNETAYTNADCTCASNHTYVCNEGTVVTGIAIEEEQTNDLERNVVITGEDSVEEETKVKVAK